MRFSLSMTQTQYACIRRHLYPDDGPNGVVMALCGNHKGADRHRLLVHKVAPVLVEHGGGDGSQASRTALVESVLADAGRLGMSLVFFRAHHPSALAPSPGADSIGRCLSIAGRWRAGGAVFATADMLPNGSVIGEVVASDDGAAPISSVAVIGDDVALWDWSGDAALPGFTARHAQAFGAGTTRRLCSLAIGVVGCSGTGSPLVEQLARLGVGRLVLIDPDVVEERNLNRIIHATRADAEARRPKAEVIARAIEMAGLGVNVLPIVDSLFSPPAIGAIADCDVVFGCMDSVEGRQWLNRIATFYLLPYFDVGVRLDADGAGGVDQVCGTVHYLQPGRSSLLGRGQFTMDEVHAEGLRRTNPALYAEQAKRGYLVNVMEERPAVVSVNMQIAAMAVNEFLARIHPFRDEPNAEYAIHRISLSQGLVYHECEPEPCRLLAKYVGRGDMEPLLDLPALSRRSQ